MCIRDSLCFANDGGNPSQISNSWGGIRNASAGCVDALRTRETGANGGARLVGRPRLERRATYGRGCSTRNVSCSPTPSAMAAYNAESTLARMLRPHYSRADDEARALIREAFTLSGDLHITGDTLHVRLDPATAPRRSRALHALCQQLTETGTRYPDTNLTISYSVKGQPDTP